MHLEPDQQLLTIAVEHQKAGRWAEAENCYRRLLATNPNAPSIANELGVVIWRGGRPGMALEFFERAFALNPASGEYCSNIGVMLQELGDLDRAAAAFETTTRLAPDYVPAYFNWGKTRMEQRRWPEAATCFRTAVTKQPDFVEGYLQLALAYLRQNLLADAIAVYREALQLVPNSAAVWNDLGGALRNQNDSDGCLEACKSAWRCDDRSFITANNLGESFKELGRTDKAVEWLRHALKLNPTLHEAHSNLIFSLQLDASATPQGVLAECRRWDRAQSRPSTLQIHLNERSPERRLRIGFVSPDFCAHSVGAQMLPFFREYDRQQFEVVCYSATLAEDMVTDVFRSLSAGWRNTTVLSDERLVNQIREDGIDILVDLALHTAGNRLKAFSWQPAPVQVTFAGYPGTTGLSAIGWRLTDRFLDPPGQHDANYSERSYRLPDSFWCFDPHGEFAEPNALPALSGGPLVFGCLVKFCKVSTSTLDLWARVLERVPHSRLLMLAPAGESRVRVQAHFSSRGIDAGRVEFTNRLVRDEYFAMHHAIDIMLDTIPYNGHSTTLDALWMGVPLLTLPGELAVSRGGLSILSTVGLPELVATSPDHYVRIAADLAADLPRLAALRASLRQQMRSSPLMDHARYARGIEGAFRAIWRDWCITGSVASTPFYPALQPF